MNICDNETGDSPLHEAVDNNDFETVKNLIAKHIDVNARNIYGSTPLHHAASEVNLEIVGYLLEKIWTAIHQSMKLVLRVAAHLIAA